MRKQRLHKVFLLLLGLTCIGLMVCVPKSAGAVSPTTINFQGKVVNPSGTNVADNTSPGYSFVFRLYNTSSPTIGATCTVGSGCLWEETDTVPVSSSIFQVELGNSCSFFTGAACNNSTPIDFSSNSLYLTMKFNGDTSGSNGFMTPLIHFTGVPYAYYSSNSAALGGLGAGNFVQLAQGVQTDSSNSNASIYINKTGSAGLVDLRIANTSVFTIANGGNTTLSPTGNNVGTTIKQTTGTATSGNIFDIQSANGASHFIQIANSAANEGTVVIQSIGATRDLTLDSGSGTIKIGGNSTVLQKSATAFTLDINNSSNSTLTLTNAGAGVLTLSVEGDINSGGNVSAGSGSVFKVGSTSGVSEAVCGANQYSQNAVATGGIITTAGACAYAVNNVGTFAAGSIANGASVTNNQITLGAADTTNPGIVTTSGTQNFGGTKVFAGAVTVQSASGLTIGTTSTVGSLALYSGSNFGTIQFANGATNTIILPASNGSANQCLMNGGTPGTLTWGACGGGVSSIAVTLTPEYPGAVLTPANDGFTHVGTMTSDFCGNDGAGSFPDVNTAFCASGQYHNYYAWTAQATNYYDIWTQWQVPSDYASIGTITLNGWTSSTSDAAKITVYKNGAACGTAGTVSTSGTWGTASPGTGSCTINAGDSLTFDVDLKVGVNSQYALAGEIVVNYTRK